MVQRRGLYQRAHPRDRADRPGSGAISVTRYPRIRCPRREQRTLDRARRPPVCGCGCRVVRAAGLAAQSVRRRWECVGRRSADLRSRVRDMSWSFGRRRKRTTAELRDPHARPYRRRPLSHDPGWCGRQPNAIVQTGSTVALDARTGRQIWRHDRPQNTRNPDKINPFNRGAAALDHRLFVGTPTSLVVRPASRPSIRQPER